MLYLRSPAKINRFLKITGKRSDGYHCLISLMQTISLSDYISIELSEKDRLEISNQRVPSDSSNLIYKAKEAFSKYINDDLKIYVKLEKNIPIGAGLGGGSSNAATVLYALNTLTGNQLSIEQLKSIAATIGADVPFFFSNGYALCKDIGDSFTNWETLPNHDNPLILCIAAESLSTPKVFSNFKTNAFSSLDWLKRYKNNLIGENDLLAAAKITSSQFSYNFESLKHSLVLPLQMSGSGSTCFIESSDENALPSSTYWTFLKVNPICRNSALWYDLPKNSG